MNTSEKFLVLIQHPEKKRFIIPEPVKNIGFVGSVLMDLSYFGNIKIESGKLIPISTTDTSKLNQAQKDVLELFQSSTKNRKVKIWISRLTRKSRKYLKGILLELEQKGIIKIIPKRFLFINYYQTQLTNKSEREKLIIEIRDVIFNDKQINNENSQIFGLIEACKLYKIICRSRDEIKICKTKLKDIMKSDAITQGVDKVIKETQAAIAGAIAASTAAAVAASSSN